MKRRGADRKAYVDPRFVKTEHSQAAYERMEKAVIRVGHKARLAGTLGPGAMAPMRTWAEVEAAFSEIGLSVPLE